MKRVLSTGDINAAAIGNNDDHCDDDNGVFTQVRSRRNKKSKKASPYVGQIEQFAAVPSGVSHSSKSVQTTDDILLLRWLQILTVTLQIKMRLTYR